MRGLIHRFFVIQNLTPEYRIDMKSFLTVLFLIFLLPLAIHGQQKTEDVIYLNDGGILRGEILDNSDDGYLKVKITGGNVFVIEMDRISEIKNENPVRQEYFKTSGYINRSGIDVLAGNSNSTRFSMINGYQFSPRFAAGIGVSFVHYDDPISLLPVYLDFNVRLLKQNNSSYLFLKTGYSFSMHTNDEMEINNHSGGFTFNPGMGVQLDLANKVGLYINMGYNVDNIEYEYDWWGNQTVNEDFTFRRINIGFGLVF